VETTAAAGDLTQIFECCGSISGSCTNGICVKASITGGDRAGFVGTTHGGFKLLSADDANGVNQNVIDLSGHAGTVAAAFEVTNLCGSGNVANCALMVTGSKFVLRWRNE